MTPPEVVRLLAIIATFDNRRVEESTIAAWSAVFDGTPWTFEECRQAVIRHARDSTDYLQPAHVIRGARIVRDEAERDERRQRALNPPPREVGVPKPENFDALVKQAQEEARAARSTG
ncbi:helicase loader [Microbacterium phage DelaGarza]|nr:helicase loader [Microbacterium phage DelaGarza]